MALSFLKKNTEEELEKLNQEVSDSASFSKVIDERLLKTESFLKDTDNMINNGARQVFEEMIEPVVEKIGKIAQVDKLMQKSDQEK